MEKNNTGKKVMIGIIIGVAIVIAIIIGIMSQKDTNQNQLETQNMTNIVVEENYQDMPNEEPNGLQPEGEKQVGI